MTDPTTSLHPVHGTALVPIIGSLSIQELAIKVDGFEKLVYEMFRSQTQAREVAHNAAEKALDKAEKAQQSYNEKSNEFRQALDDQQKQMVSRSQFIQEMHYVNEKIDALRDAKNEGFGKMRGMTSLLIGVAGFIGLSLTAIGLVIKF